MKGYDAIMEKTITEEKVTYIRKHEFYCDKCGKYLGVTEEYESGGYNEVGYIYLKFLGMAMKGHYCDECKKEINNQIKEALIEIGFKEIKD